MDNIEKLIGQFDKKYKKENKKYIFKYNENNICYDSVNKQFFLDKSLFSKLPHVMSDGSLCLYGNRNIQLNEKDEEILVRNTLKVYIPWLFNMPPEIKVIEFINEIEYYLKKIYKKKVKKFKNIDHIYTKIKISTPIELWETIDTLKLNKIYEIYPNQYPEYKIYIRKNKDDFVLNYDLYNKSRLRILGHDFKDIKEKTCFIGVGSVNSYVIKQCLARDVKEIVLIDKDTFKIDNAFRFAFPYKNKSKIECVQEFIKILRKTVKVEGYNINIDSKSSKQYVRNCTRIFVSVDDFYSWLEVLVYLKINALETAKITFIGIDAFGGFGKFINTNTNNIIEDAKKFLFYNEGSSRRMMIGDGCGKSLAVYDEEALNKLAKNVVNKSEVIGKVEKVEF